MKWVKAESDERPVELDDKSCRQLVYIRKNITEEHKQEDGEERTVYTYMEAEIDRGIYDALQAQEMGPSTQEMMQSISNLEMQNEMIMIALDLE